MLSPVLAALLEAPSGLVRLMDALAVLTFFLSPLVLGMLGVCAVPTNRAISIYTHRASVRDCCTWQQCLDLPWVIPCVPWARWEGGQKLGIWSLTDGWE